MTEKEHARLKAQFKQSCDPDVLGPQARLAMKVSIARALLIDHLTWEGLIHVDTSEIAADLSGFDVKGRVSPTKHGNRSVTTPRRSLRSAFAAGQLFHADMFSKAVPSDTAMDIITTEFGYAGLCVGLAVGMLLAPNAFDGVEFKRISDGKRKGNRR
jgi:hypothetical protein